MGRKRHHINEKTTIENVVRELIREGINSRIYHLPMAFGTLKVQVYIFGRETR